MTERSAEKRFRQETGWLAGGLLLRVATIRHTTDTFLFISHTTNVLLFKFCCNIFIGTGFGGLEVACWPLVPKFAGSNPAEAVGFLRAKKSSARLPSEGK